MSNQSFIPFDFINESINRYRFNSVHSGSLDTVRGPGNRRACLAMRCGIHVFAAPDFHTPSTHLDLTRNFFAAGMQTCVTYSLVRGRNPPRAPVTLGVGKVRPVAPKRAPGSCVQRLPCPTNFRHH